MTTTESSGTQVADPEWASGLRAALRAPRLRATIVSQTTSLTANQVVGLVVPWLVLQRTGDPLAAGLVLLATGSASVVGTLLGGALVDRFGARRMAIVADALSAITLLVLPIGLATDVLPLWLIIVSQVAGILFDGPGVVARNAMLAATARGDRIAMTSATSLENTLRSSATFIGPLLGGVLLTAIDAGPTLVLASVVFIIAIVIVLRVPASMTPPNRSETNLLGDLREGLAFLWREELLGPMTLLLAIWVAAAAPMATLILPTWFQSESLTAVSLGIALGAQAIGGILGGLLYVSVNKWVRPRVWFIMSNLVNIAALTGFAVTGPGTVWAVAALFVSGFALAGSMPILNAAYYTKAPAEMIGRVTGAGWALVLAALPLASILMGWLLSIAPPATGMIVVIAGDLIVLLYFMFLPAFKLIDRYR